MNITQNGDYIRLALVERLKGHEWTKQFDFTIHKSNFEELKRHMIKALEEFEVK